MPSGSLGSLHALTKSVRSRVKPTKRVSGLEDAIDAIVDVVVTLETKAQKINADPRLTAKGKADALRELAAKETLPAIDAAQVPIAKAADHLQQARRAFQVQAPDRSDLTGAMERQEIRAMIRAMGGPTERVAFLLGSKDDRIVDAVLSAPADLSGLTPKHFEALQKHTLERRFGPQVEEIAEDEESVLAADTVRQMAIKTIGDIIGAGDQQMAGLVRTSRDTPWLVRQGDSVLRVIPGEVTYPPATAEEIGRGKFYASIREYHEDNPGAALQAAHQPQSIN